MSQNPEGSAASVDTSGFFNSNGQPTPALQQRIARLSTATGHSTDELLERARNDPGSVALSEHERQDLLQETILQLSWEGYQVTSQTDTTAEFVKPKKFSIFLAVALLILTVGIGLIIYVIWYWQKDDDHASVSIGILGEVTATGVSDIVDPAYATSA